jgi:hypothetical protein
MQMQSTKNAFHGNGRLRVALIIATGSEAICKFLTHGLRLQNMLSKIYPGRDDGMDGDFLASQITDPVRFATSGLRNTGQG